MATNRTVLPLLRREMRTASSRLSRASPSVVTALASPVRSPATIFSNTNRSITHRSAPLISANQTRSFSQSVLRRFTDENGNFDPRSLDRESDEVDVCIVGGGMFYQTV